MAQKKSLSRIYLTGFSGVGKSRLGKRLARKLGFSFLDLDVEIEKKSKMSIQEIFKTKGEKFFRKQETALLYKTFLQSSVVVALGGGTLLNKKNLIKIKSKGTLIYLKNKKKILLKNSKKLSNRPLTYKKTTVKINSLFLKRQNSYQKSDFVWDLSKKKNLDLRIEELF